MFDKQEPIEAQQFSQKRRHGGRILSTKNVSERDIRASRLFRKIRARKRATNSSGDDEFSVGDIVHVISIT